MTDTTYFINYLYDPAQQPQYPEPPPAEVRADLAMWKPAAVVAVATPRSRLGRYLIGLFGQPTTRHGQVLGWRLVGR
jgi:hypothetical protein